MFCKKVNKTVGGNVNDNKKLRKNIYLGMTKEEYLSLFNNSFLTNIKREKNRKKIIYVPHATWEDIGMTGTIHVYDGKIHRAKK